MVSKMDQGTWNASFAEAIKDRNITRLGELVRFARDCGMTYDDIESRAFAFAGLDSEDWDSLLRDVERSGSEGGEVRP